jgi:CBS domain-containing protein
LQEVEMQVSELLQEKGPLVVTVQPDATVTDALSEMARHNIGAVIVSRDGRSIEGILSERDVVRSLTASGPTVLDGPVSAIMSSDVHTASPDDAVDLLMTTMTERRFRHIPVVDRGRVVGIVSIGDVVKSRTDELERDRAALVDYIGAR